MTTATTTHAKAAGHPILSMPEPSFLSPIPLAEQRSERSHELVYVSAALATMGTCPTWDARMTSYLSCRALMIANHEFGAFTESNSTLKTLDRDATATEDAHTSQFEKPFWQAAVHLAMTPAPTLRAALFKVDLVREDNLDADLTITPAPMTIIAEDFVHLAQRHDDPVARFYRALDDVSKAQIDAASYQAAIEALDEWAPTTPADLLRKLIAVLSDATTPANARLARAMEQAGRIFDPTTGRAA